MLFGVLVSAFRELLLGILFREGVILSVIEEVLLRVVTFLGQLPPVLSDQVLDCLVPLFLQVELFDISPTHLPRVSQRIFEQLFHLWSINGSSDSPPFSVSDHLRACSSAGGFWRHVLDHLHSAHGLSAWGPA